MPQENLLRMIKLAEEFFATKNDPTQLSIDEHVMAQLHAVHPATISQKKTRKGPVAWVLVIPTTSQVMKKFLKGEYNERELLENTPIGGTYDTIYLCSALVLPEYRRKGLAKELTIKSIQSIRKKHPIKHLFVWEFSNEGRTLAQMVAKEVGLPLRRRLDR